MKMRLYNSLSRQIEPVTTDDGTFRMYVCGVTPYDTTHLGHAFTYVCFDVLERYLEYRGYQTITVQNVTDIDDDILRQSKKVGIRWDELVEREVTKFLADLDALNVRRPDHFPYATEEIDQIIKMVADLVDKGYAYEKAGSVYYEIRHDTDFGQLANLDYDTMLTTANERGNFPDDSNKRDPLDFVLWQAAQPDEPSWSSPWGEGRPGWHIECSAMSMRYLGDQVDIHAGGADLLFPHHTCEIAQSERYSGKRPFVRYWFHTAMVRLDGEKMSKSLGNMLFVTDLRQQYSANAIRSYLLSHRYREQWEADDAEERLPVYEAMMSRWLSALKRDSTDDGPVFDPQTHIDAFEAAMDDDLDTATALKRLDELAIAIDAQATRGSSVSAAQQALLRLADVLGLQLNAHS
jgi:L-cysteine:1D-myo-inositol 2-amino-2-deoxy-alpha-D-glucopyranoside ligase